MKALAAMLLAVAVLGPVAQARGNKPVVEPGKYTEWGDDIDSIEIVKPFHASDYETIAVTKFDSSATPIPDGKEEVSQKVLASFSDTLSEGLSDDLKAKAKVAQQEKPEKSAKTLILRGKIEKLDPGSRAKRYVAGFGAGAAGVRIAGELVDAKSGTVLVKFTQERRASGTFKFAGGNDMQVLRDSIHALGKDVAHIIDAFE